MTVTSGEISRTRPKPSISGLWHGSFPKIELSIPRFSGSKYSDRRLQAHRPAPLVRPPFRIKWPERADERGSARPYLPLYNLPIYNLLAMTAAGGNPGVSLGGVAQPPSSGSQSSQTGVRPNGKTKAGNSAADGATDRQARSDEVPKEADPDDLHNLVVEHGDAIYRLALSVVRDKSLAEDVAQEALVKAWLALPSFRGDASLRSWLLRITHNTAISTLRRRRAVLVDPQEMPEEPTRVERSVESRVQGQVVMDQFVEALETLDELSRSIVVLRELEGLTYEEISDVLGVPMPTVKTRLLRARRRLSNVLREWA